MLNNIGIPGVLLLSASPAGAVPAALLAALTGASIMMGIN